MISFRKIDLIAIILIAAALSIVIYLMCLPQEVLTGNSVGSFSYDEIHTADITEDDYYTSYADGAAKINLNNQYTSTNSPNVEINGSSVTILGSGVYVISGTLEDGSIIVDSADSAVVRLVLNGVNITSSDFSAIYVRQAEKTILSLVPGTENFLSDGSSYDEEKLEEQKPSAALHSRDDLTINGSGSLTINANYQDGIKADDILKITEGSITINAADDGINANDYILALDVDLNIVSGGDGIKCDHSKEENGFIVFESTNISIESECDGISASSSLFMNDTETNIVSGGGSQNASKSSSEAPPGGMGGFRGMGFGGGFGGWNSQTEADTPSTKSIKATDIEVRGGNFVLDSAEDCLHSDNDMTIEGGVFSILSGDDGVHADMNLILNPESIDISKCVEGLEGAYITIDGGNISIVSSDDGINAAGENSSGFFGGGMMHSSEEKTSEEDIYLTINGGHIYIETSGDGMDSNGSAVMNGGYMEIYGPEDGGNGSIDVGDGGYVLIMNSGSLLAVGSSGMAEHPSENSPQRTVVFNLGETYSAGSTISIIDSGGSEIISGYSNKKFEWLCASTEKITEGETYRLIIDGEEIAEVTSSENVSSYGSSSGFGMGGGGNRNGGRGFAGNRTTPPTAVQKEEESEENSND